MYLYFIRCHSNANCIKIGRAVNPEARLNELQVGNPHDLSLIFAYKLKSAKHSVDAETRVHRTFKYANVRGEWFSADSALREFIAALATDMPLSTACEKARQMSRNKYRQHQLYRKKGQKMRPLRVNNKYKLPWETGQNRDEALDMEHLAEINDVFAEI